MTDDGFVEPTTRYWQEIMPPGSVPDDAATYQYGFPAKLPDGRILMLPIRRRLDDPSRAVASLIPNHASFAVIDALVTTPPLMSLTWTMALPAAIADSRNPLAVRPVRSSSRSNSERK